MSINDKLDDVGGVFTIEVIRDGKNGPEVINRQQCHNLIVNSGKKQVWRIACGTSTTVFDQMRIGTCAAAPASTNTNVVSPVTGTINTVDSKSLISGRTHQLVISYPSGAGSKSATGIKEVVVLNQNTSTGGSALARGTFTAVNKTTSDKLLHCVKECRGLLAA